MMKLLSRIGKILLAVEAHVTGFSPIIKALLPARGDAMVDRAEATLSQVAGIIVIAEGMGEALKLPGAQKLVAATPMVAKILLESSIVAGHKIADPILFQAGSGKIASGMADILNSLKDDALEKVA